jgi:hypothetical protein
VNADFPHINAYNSENAPSLQMSQLKESILILQYTITQLNFTVLVFESHSALIPSIPDKGPAD